jgi:hypothetical protein
MAFLQLLKFIIAEALDEEKENQGTPMANGDPGTGRMPCSTGPPWVFFQGKSLIIVP